jgi:type IV pilus assembly protein PilY1
MKTTGSKVIFIVSLFTFLSLCTQKVLAAEPTMDTYTSYPIFQLNTVAPNILIILDNSGSMNSQAYTGPYDPNTDYYGYFEPHKKYSYASNVFVRDPSGQWDGNFLNWLTMRRIDVTRKVLMGGLATSRQGSGNQTNIGETPGETGYDFVKSYGGTDPVTPLNNGTTYNYIVSGGNFLVNGKTYVIRVVKDMNTNPDEAYNFVDGNIAGVLQKVGAKARWGNEFFNYGTGNGESGGYIASTIGTNMASLITDLQNTQCNTWTPLAEAYYVAMQYFKQQDVQAGLDYPNNVIPHSNVGQDPYYDGTEYVPCAKSFVILLTDGASTMDQMIPNFLKDYDNDGKDSGTVPDSGSDYLDDVAYYAHINDLRPDLPGDQNLTLYTIYAFGDDPTGTAEQLLKDAAKNGGFVEKDGITGPDLQEEWDSNGDGIPDTYYRADNGYQLEAKILQAVNDILERAASGTAVSVLATSGEGEGNLVQAYYRPTVTRGLNEYKWVGYLQSLWVDPLGNLREDTDGDLSLDVTKDRVVTYFVDPASGDTKIKRFNVSASDPYPDQTSAPYELLDLNEIYPLWEAGSLLAQKSPTDRKIFTFIDKDANGLVTDTPSDPFDPNGEVVNFDISTDSCNGENCIGPYLGVKDNATWSYLGATYDLRVTNLINYIRGNDISGLRSRTIDGTHVWKLGDIVDSTPVSVARPPDNYNIIYGDESYQAYYDAFKDRETVVYVGANDGMLHAFTSWKYDPATKHYTKPSTVTGIENIGDEIWAYIPESLLPQLKWLASPDYTHVFYVDLKPKVFDAKILAPYTHYDSGSDDNWGTFILLGLNMGGKHIQVTDDFDYNSGTADTTRDFYPTYALIDVTEPRNPRLLWERSYGDLEMSTSFPAIVRVKGKWFGVFGSGPSDYDATTSKKGHIFVVDLKTGNPYKSGTNDWLFQTGESNAFMNSPVSLDKDLNYNVDAIYFGETYLQGGNWGGKVYKVTVPWADSSGNYDGHDLANYSDNPLDATNPWRLAPLFNATRPVTASVSLSKDAFGNLWVYGGTGRFFSTEDKVNTDTQYIFGVKDPFYNMDHTPTGLYADNYYHNYKNSLELQMANLFNADSYAVTTAGEVFQSGVSVGSWTDLLDTARASEGWIRSLSTPKERVISKPALLGGIVFTPSFVPSSDVCGFGGDSYLYGFYYETGTSYYKEIFDQGVETMEIAGQEKDTIVEKISLGAGWASSLGVHSGMEAGATGFIQQSTGSVQKEALSPAFNFKSGLRSWQEK